MKIQRAYLELRYQLLAQDMSFEDLGECCGLTANVLSTRFTGRVDWSLHEMYAIMDALQLPMEEMAKYFPRNGVK